MAFPGLPVETQTIATFEALLTQAFAAKAYLDNRSNDQLSHEELMAHGNREVLMRARFSKILGEEDG